MPVFLPVPLRVLPRAVVELIRLALLAAAICAALFMAAASVRLWLAPSGPPLTSTTILLAVVLLEGPLLALRLLLARAVPACSEATGSRLPVARWEWWVQASGTGAAILLAIALAVRADTAGGATAAIGLIGAAELVARWKRPSGWWGRDRLTSGDRPCHRATELNATQGTAAVFERNERSESMEQPEASEAIATGTEAETWEAAPPAEEDTGSVEQQVERIREPSGRTTVVGWQRLDWEAKQRRAVAHVAFCPPLARRPEVDVWTDGDEHASVHAVEAETYGVRIELRRPIRQAGHPASMRVFFSASEPEETVDGEADCDV